MPELEFTIGTASGEFQLHVHGIAGPACDDVAKLVKKLLGNPSHDEATAEYRLRPSVRIRSQANANTRAKRA